jgi:hypothetical protein
MSSTPLWLCNGHTRCTEQCGLCQQVQTLNEADAEMSDDELEEVHDRKSGKD